MAFSARTRLGIEALIAVLAAVALVRLADARISMTLVFPFFKEDRAQPRWFFVFFAAFIMVGAATRLNLTDGLDGLAIVPVMIAAASFGMIAYLIRKRRVRGLSADSLRRRHGELAVLCGAVLGAGLGFLWFKRAAGLRSSWATPARWRSAA